MTDKDIDKCKEEKKFKANKMIQSHVRYLRKIDIIKNRKKVILLCSLSMHIYTQHIFIIRR